MENSVQLDKLSLPLLYASLIDNLQLQLMS